MPRPLLISDTPLFGEEAAAEARRRDRARVEVREESKLTYLPGSYEH